MTPPVPTARGEQLCQGCLCMREAGLDHGLEVFPQPEALDTVWDGHSVSSAGRSGDRGHVPSVSSVLRNGDGTEQPAK